MTGTVLVSTVLHQARKWLGTKEIPAHSNRTPIGERFGWNGVPWCAETVCVVLLDSGFKIRKNASARGLHDELIRLKWHAVPKGEAKAGDVVFYDWPTEPGWINHTGFVEGRTKDGRIIAIEGNCNDQVMRVHRSLDCVAAIVRPPYKLTGGSARPAAMK